jgi:chromosome partitioning protein
MPSAQSRPRVIAFANQKGGVAKTTTTLNLAVAFVEKGFRVLCVDMDPQGNLTMSQGIDPDSLETSMYDVLVHHLSIREVVRRREVDVACASIDLAGGGSARSRRRCARSPRTTTSSASTRRRASACSRSTR